MIGSLSRRGDRTVQREGCDDVVEVISCLVGIHGLMREGEGNGLRRRVLCLELLHHRDRDLLTGHETQELLFASLDQAILKGLRNVEAHGRGRLVIAIMGSVASPTTELITLTLVLEDFRRNPGAHSLGLGELPFLFLFLEFRKLFFLTLAAFAFTFTWRSGVESLLDALADRLVIGPFGALNSELLSEINKGRTCHIISFFVIA